MHLFGKFVFIYCIFLSFSAMVIKTTKKGYDFLSLILTAVPHCFVVILFLILFIFLRVLFFRLLLVVLFVCVLVIVPAEMTWKFILRLGGDINCKVTREWYSSLQWQTTVTLNGSHVWPQWAGRPGTATRRQVCGTAPVAGRTGGRPCCTRHRG